MRSASLRAASSATSSLPSTNTMPVEIMLTDDASGTSSPPSFNNAAILAMTFLSASFAAWDQPARSRILTNAASGARSPISSKASKNSGASCVQATSSLSALPASSAKRSNSTRHRWRATFKAPSPPAALANASASMFMVSSHEQTRTSLPWSFIFRVFSQWSHRIPGARVRCPVAF